MTIQKPQMNQLIEASVAAARRALLDGLARAQAAGAKDFVDYARGKIGDDLPCWGNLAERFERTFQTDAERIEFWKTLRDTPDPRAVMLFLDANRTRDRVLAQVMLDAGALPEDVQVALVTLCEVQPLVASHLTLFGPAARLLWQQGPAAIRKEQRLTSVRVARLKALVGTRTAEPEPEPTPGKDDTKAC